MGTAGGFALVVPVVLTVGKQVFLRVVTAITTVMRCMTPAVSTVKKAAVGGKKNPAGAGTKTAAWGKPLPNPPKAPPRPSPRGGSPFLLCLRRLGGTPSPWGGLGRGFSALATPTELPRVRTIRYGLTTHAPSVHTIHSALIIHNTWVRTIYYGLTTHDAWVLTIHNKWRPTSSGNSVGVAFPQPRVAGEARYPGYRYIKG